MSKVITVDQFKKQHVGSQDYGLILPPINSRQSVSGLDSPSKMGKRNLGSRSQSQSNIHSSVSKKKSKIENLISINPAEAPRYEQLQH